MVSRVLLVDDHKVVRDGLRNLIDRQPDMEVIAEAADGREAVRVCAELSPNVVIIDVGMPHLNGIEATRQICALDRRVRVIALSMHSDGRFVAGMLDAGASGYLLKDCAFEELHRAVRTVLVGGVYVSPEVSKKTLPQAGTRSPGSQSKGALVLTPREREILQLLAEGQTTRTIAAACKVSPKTVETHRQNIMKKTGVGSLPELTKFAIREGLTFLDE